MSSIVAHSNIFQEQAVPLNFTNVTLEHVVKNVGFKSLIAHDIHNRKEIIVIVYLNYFKESKIWSKQVLFSDRIHFVHKWHTFIFFIATILIVSQNNSTRIHALSSLSKQKYAFIECESKFKRITYSSHFSCKFLFFIT